MEHAASKSKKQIEGNCVWSDWTRGWHFRASGQQSLLKLARYDGVGNLDLSYGIGGVGSSGKDWFFANLMLDSGAGDTATKKRQDRRSWECRILPEHRLCSRANLM